MNEGYSFEPNEKFSWQSHQMGKEGFHKLKDGLLSLKALCDTYSKSEDEEDAVFLEAMGDVLESLEKTLVHHFETSGHTVSPKSSEPWD